jgi:hypothetical protein
MGTAVLLATPSAFAGARIWDNSFSTCTSANCSSLTIPGTVTNPSSNNDPFEVQVFAGTNECVRLEVTQSLQGVDLEMVVRAPNGAIYRNDDGNGGGSFNNPMVQINGTPNSGWYSVSINHWNGVASYADFVLTYGRYNVGNVNCAAPTAPSLAPSGKLNGAQEPAGVLVPGVGTVPAAR